MPRVRTKWDGLFAWYDIMSVDEAVTAAFYSGLFGWDTSAEPRPTDGYRMLSFDGRGFGGSLPWKETGRSFWMGYVQVTGIEERVAKARKLGATIFVELMEIPNVGRFSVLDDPTGAPFYLYEVAPEYRVTETGYNRGSGHIIWNELITNDLTTGAAFYHEIAGWELFPVAPEPLSYTVAKVDGVPVAGLFQPSEPPANSAWIISVSTSDIDATIARAVELGGSVVHPANRVPGVGRTAWVADPTGGVFGLMEPEPGWLDRL
jgi:predicted enzyme related to lactoylglutathione lyase